jgi:TFIIF-interacting CTD phosphatase-like protein
MTNDIKIIMEYYKNINTNYYNSFIKIFNNISIQSEAELINYFFNKIIKNNDSLSFITVNKSIKNNKKIEISNMKHQLKRNKTNENLNIISPSRYPYTIKKNIFQNLSIKNMSNNITSLNNNILDSKSMHNLSKSNIYKKSVILKSSMKKIKNKNIYKIGIPYIKTPSNKKYTLILDINKTLGFNNTEKGIIKLRNGLFSFLSMIKPYYELISFSCEPREVTDPILKEIESEKKYFDYNLNREHAFLYDNCLVKDISLVGRDISKIIVIDDDENSFKLNKGNGIKITPFNEESKNDNVLFELKKILILIYKKNYDDVRIGLKEFRNDIKSKVNLF